jgi:LmbE family N-acetylglucosaminyl deacetylase
MKKSILIIAAHPDDEVLGCGATVSKLADEGYDIYTLILGEGVTSRDMKRDAGQREEEIDKLKQEINAANNKLGVKKVFTYDFPDNRFDSVDLLDIVKKVEEIKQKTKPSIIFTHYKNDLNVDHRVTYNAVMTATRPLSEETVKEIYSFEVLSSTEWNYPLSFSPNTFFDVTSTIRKKKEAMELYGSELRDFPHPRSIEGIELNAKNWGMKTGIKYAEAFLLVRMIK